MSVQDAINTREIAQKIKSVMPKIQEGFFNERALLKLAEKRVKWGGSHTKFDWRIRYVPTDETPTWGGGELGIRSFEEQKVANELELPYCYLEKTWGVGNRTIEANKNANTNKNFDAIKENLKLAQIFMYDAYGPAIYNPNISPEDPVGLWAAIGQAYTDTSIAIVDAGETYAGKTLNTAASTTAGDLLVRTGNATNGRGWDDAQFAPLVADVNEMCDAAGVPSLTEWSTGCVQILDYMANAMSMTSSISGTGSRIQPDIALMNSDPWQALRAKISAAQSTGYQIPLGREELVLSGFPNIVVNTLTCIKDTDVPIDTDHGGGGAIGEEIVFVLDSNQFNICTTHTKSEGIIKSEYDPDIAMVSGVVGALTANIAFQINSPTAVGACLGCYA